MGTAAQPVAPTLRTSQTVRTEVRCTCRGAVPLVVEVHSQMEMALRAVMHGADCDAAVAKVALRDSNWDVSAATAAVRGARSSCPRCAARPHTAAQVRRGACRPARPPAPRSADEESAGPPVWAPMSCRRRDSTHARRQRQQPWPAPLRSPRRPSSSGTSRGSTGRRARVP
jgi:hypothetical protein